MLLHLPSLLLLAALLAVPFNVLAVSSKTYTINSAASQNYTTTGTTLTDKATSSWYNPSYSYRLTLTINKEHIGETLTDFPIVVQLNSNQSQLFNNSRDDGNDLIFTDTNNLKLSHEIETFDKNNKEATIWVKVPKLTSTEDTILYLYYGNPKAGDNQNKTDVWSNGYTAVHHLNQDPAGSVKDSTEENNNGVQIGGMNANDSLVNGNIGKALKFDGSNDFITGLGKHSFIQNTANFSVGSWVKLNNHTSNAYQVIFGNSQAASVDKGFTLFYENRTGIGSKQLYLSVYRGVNGSYAPIDMGSDSNAITDNDWHYVETSADGTTARLRVDGREIKSISVGTLATGESTRGFNIGTGQTTSGFDGYLNGFVSEARISNKARSGAWVKAEYSNQSGDEDFLTISSPTTTGTTSNNSLITLKPTKALSYSTLSHFTPNGSANITYQLSPNSGTTWYYYTKAGWTKTSANTPTKSSSANDISKHLSTLPNGTGKLLWRAILQPNSTLDSIKIDYTPGNSTETTATSNMTDTISTLYKLVFGTNPTTEQHTYWEGRLKDKPTLPALFGAMQWQKLFGK